MQTIGKLIKDGDFIDFINSDVKFFVDIGASCHSEYSESEILINNGFRGIMFECDESKYSTQNNKMSSYPVTVLPDKVTPENILSLLESNNVVDGFYLTLDIDGYDFFVLDKILSKYSPSFIVSEINEKIPPPLKFTVNYDPSYFWDGSHYYGYSLSMLEILLNKYGYKIKILDYNNIVLVKGIQEESILDIYKNGYLNRTDRKSMYYWNSNIEHVYNLSQEDQISFFNNLFNDGIKKRDFKLYV